MKSKILIIFIIASFQMNAQSNLKYSGLFDSYYNTGPIKFTLEPCLTKMYGDLKKGGPGGGIGVGVNYKILPPLYFTSNFRYLLLTATDHDEKRNASYNGSTMQLNLLADYHFIYDLMRKQKDRRRGNKFINAYFSTGASLNKTSTTGFSYHLPLIFGLPVRLTPKFSLVPEIGYFKTFSDEMDGVFGVGTANNSDGYMVVSFKLMFSPFDKRRKPKQIRATNKFEEGGGGGNPSFDDEDDGFDSFDDDSEMEDDIEEPVQEEEIIENVEEEVIEEEIIENTEDEFIEEESIEEDNGPKYDEDGFLIDD